MSTTEQARPLFSVADVARRLGISTKQVRRLSPELGAFKVGRLVRFDPDRVDAWIAERKAEAEQGRAASTT